MQNLISVSGGKDSTALLLLAIERGEENISGAFCDTGNEHPQTLEYVPYLEETTGIPIKWIKVDFTEWWWKNREYKATKWPEKCVPDEVVKSALEVMDLGPTGIPFLDLCIIKGHFPSRKKQFCTQYLKTEPLVEYALELIDANGPLTSWQGIRAEESPNRAKQPMFEDRGGGYFISRPILHWTAAEVFAFIKKHGVKPNPLYLQGMNRVGCMPCINVGKNELLEISKRFPEHIEKIKQWELTVCKTSKCQNATFIQAPGETETAYERGNILQQVEWAKTQHGGRKYDMFKIFDETPKCASSYGLCE